MSLEPREYLRHMLDEADYLVESSRELDGERFAADPHLRRAFVRSLEIMGEAAKKVPEQLRTENPHVQWRDMARLRDRLIHGYFGVDYQIVWDIVQNAVPELRRQLQSMLDQA